MEGPRIFLHQPYKRGNSKAHVFKPGDRVAGKVVLSLLNDEKIDSVFIEFKGKCHTQHGRGRDEHLHEIQMFSLRKTLFQGPFKMRKDKFEYPFAFTFPGTWNHKFNEFREQYQWKELGVGIGEMPLPPSCGPEEDFGGKCEIYYRLTATVPRTFSDWEDKITLNFSPCRLELSPESNHTKSTVREPNHRNFRLGDDGRPRALSKREMMKHGFHKSSDTNVMEFTLAATAPTCIVLGQSYPVLVTLVSKTEGLEGIEPEFVLKDYQLRFKSKTDIRVPGAIMDHVELLEGHIPLSNGKLDAVLPVGTSRRIQGLFPAREGLAPPSFTSVAVRRTYALELKATIVCLGEETGVKVVWPSVEVLSSKMEEEVEEAMRAIENWVGDLEARGESALPAYGEHVETSIVERGEENEPQLPSYEIGLKGKV